MSKKRKTTPFNSLNSQSKDKQIILNTIIKEVEKGTGLSLKELWLKYNEELMFYVGLYHITTTKKALCSALKIPIEAGCRYKRKYEENGQLVQSLNEVICPFTKHPAHKLSTNPKEFSGLLINPQTKLF